MTHQRGNILFLILLAVVLFAALSYAVTSSTRGGGNNANAESADAAGASIVQFLIDMQTQITRTKMVDNVKEDAFNFCTISNNSPDNIYRFNNNSANCWNCNNACVGGSCVVFKPWNSTGIAAQTFEKYADSVYVADAYNANYVKGGHFTANTLIIQNVGTPSPELVGIVWGITPDICNAVNRKFGIVTNYTNATTTDSIGEVSGTSRPGSLNALCGTGPIVYDTTRTYGDQAAIFAGQRTFCAPLNNPTAVGSKLAILHVLIER